MERVADEAANICTLIWDVPTSIQFV